MAAKSPIMIVCCVLRVAMTLKRSWLVVNLVVLGKQAMTQLSVPPMDSIPVFTMVQAAASSSGLNSPFVPAAICCRLASGPALARSMACVAFVDLSLTSCSEKDLRSDEYGQTTRILPILGPDSVPTFSGNSLAILSRRARTTACAL
eukprot:3212788-Heterocapsa_arctica.AAC.1